VCCCPAFFLLFAGNSSTSSSSSPLLPLAARPLLSLLLAVCLCFFGVRLVPPSTSLLDYTFKVETKNTNTNIKHVSFIIAVQLTPQGYECNKQYQTVMGLHVLTTVNTRLVKFLDFWSGTVNTLLLLGWCTPSRGDCFQHSGLCSSFIFKGYMSDVTGHLMPKMRPLHGVATLGNKHPYQVIEWAISQKYKDLKTLVPREGMLHSLVQHFSVLKMDAAGSSEISIHILKLHSFTTQLFTLQLHGAESFLRS